MAGFVEMMYSTSSKSSIVASGGGLEWPTSVGDETWRFELGRLDYGRKETILASGDMNVGNLRYFTYYGEKREQI